MSSRQTRLNFFSSSTYSMLMLGLSVIATPVFLKTLGDTRFGASKLILDYLGYLGLLELGVSGALHPLFAKNQDPKITGRIFLGAFKITLTLALLMLILGILMMLFVPTLIQMGPEFKTELQLAFVIGVFGMSLFVFQPLRSWAEARGRSYQVHLGLALQGATTLGLQLFLSLQGFGLIGYMSGWIIGMFCLPLTLLILNQRELNTFSLKKLRVDIETETKQSVREILKLNGPVFILNLRGRLSLMSDAILLGLFNTTANLVPFAITTRFFGIIQTQLQNIGNSSWAELAGHYFKEEHELFRGKLYQYTQILVSLAVILIIPLMLVLEDFIGLWVGSDRFGGNALILSSGLVILGQSIFSFWGWCFGGTGKSAALVKPSLLETGINIAASFALTAWLSHSTQAPFSPLVGPVLGSLVGFIFINSWVYPQLLRKHFGINLKTLALATGMPLAISIVPVLICLLVNLAIKEYGGFSAQNFIAVALRFGIYAIILAAVLARFRMLEGFVLPFFSKKNPERG